jgi:hypothetical protein
MKFPLSCAILLMLAAPSTVAERPKEIQIQISVIAVGDPPQPRYEIRDDRRHLLHTPASEHPPGEILVREKRSDNESFKAIPLGLNTPTGTITYRGESTLLLYRDDLDDKRSEFASLALPELRDDLTIFLVRNRSAKSWERPPHVYYYDNSLTAFPNDSTRLINLSAVPVRARINEGRVLDVAPGQHAIVRIPRNDQGILSYRVAAIRGEDLLPLIDSATTTMPDTRFNLFIYNSDSAYARAPVNIASYFERPVHQVAE